MTYENYDVTVAAERDVSFEEIGDMMRALLAERFKLVARVEGARAADLCARARA